MNHCIKHPELAEEGQQILTRTILNMPVLDLISLRFQNLHPFEGLKISMCQHLTAETAALAVNLKQGGAEIYMAASNPRSTQEAVVAALVKYHGIHVFANADETQEEYLAYMDEVLKIQPDIILDDGAAILPRVYDKYPELAGKLIGTTEQTTAGVAKVEQMDQSGRLLHPVIAANSSKSKHMYDNRYGVGQTFIEAFMKVTETMICGKTVVVCGFGYCGKGIAERAKGMGANVIVTEIDPFKALDAVMSGYRVMSLQEAAAFGDVFVAVTGNTKIVDYPVMEDMKSGAILINCGSGTTEIHVAALKENAISVHPVKEHLDEYVLKNGKHLFVMADGRVANLVCASGNPADVMDMSFSVVAFGVEYLVKNRGKLENHMLRIPLELDLQVVRLKLGAMGIHFDKQTDEQREYARQFVVHT